MSIQFPPELDWLATVAAGTFPKLDEDEIGLLAGTASVFAEDFGGLANDVQSALAGAAGAVGGQGGGSFDSYIRKLTADGPQVLTGMQRQLQDMALNLRETKLSVETAKLQVIEMLAWLAFELLWALAMAPFTGGASEAAAPAMVEATQSILISVGRSALSQILKGAANMAGMDILTQAIEILKGDKSSFDFKEVLDSAGMGALAGAVGMGMGMGAGKIFGEWGGTFTGKMVNGVTVGAASNYVTQIIMSAANGHVDTNYLGAVNGAFGGAFGAALHGRGGGGKGPHDLGGPDGPHPPTDLTLGKVPAPELPHPGVPPTGFYAGHNLRDATGLPLWVQPNENGSLLVHSLGDITKESTGPATVAAVTPVTAVTGSHVPVSTPERVTVPEQVTVPELVTAPAPEHVLTPEPTHTPAPTPQEAFFFSVKNLPDTLIVGTPGEVHIGADGLPVAPGALGTHLNHLWDGVQQQLPAEGRMPSQILLTSHVSPAEYQGLQHFADTHGVDVLAPDGTVKPLADGRGLVVERAPLNVPGGSGKPVEGGWQVISPGPEAKLQQPTGAGTGTGAGAVQHLAEPAPSEKTTPVTPTSLTAPIDKTTPTVLTTGEKAPATAGRWDGAGKALTNPEAVPGAAPHAIPEAKSAQSTTVGQEPAVKEQTTATTSGTSGAPKTPRTPEVPAPVTSTTTHTTTSTATTGKGLPEPTAARTPEQPAATETTTTLPLSVGSTPERRTVSFADLGGGRSSTEHAGDPAHTPTDEPWHLPAKREALWQSYLKDLRDQTGGHEGTIGTITLDHAEQWVYERVNHALDQAVTGYQGPKDIASMSHYLEGHENQALTSAWHDLLGQLGVHTDQLGGPLHLPGGEPLPPLHQPAPEATSHTTPHTSGPTVPLATGVWFPRENPTPLQQTAAHAVPGAEGWHLLVGHGEPGKIEINGQLVDHTGVLPHTTGTDKQAFITCYADAPVDGGLSLIHQSHLDTGKPTLGPTHEAIVTTNGDVISGTMGIDAKTGRPVVLPKGTWTVYENGQPRTLNTPSLKEAWNQLDATVKVNGPAPEQAVGFVYGIAQAQHDGLAHYGYAPVGSHVPNASRPDSFFTALTAMATPHLTTHLGGSRPTEVRLRRALHDALRADLGGPSPRYARFLGPHQTPTQLLDDLRIPGRWSSQLGELAPHLAADVFHLDLGVVGAGGVPEGVGHLLGPHRTGHPDGNPLLLVRVGDNHYVPTTRVPGGGAHNVPRPNEVHGLVQNGPAVSHWTRPLTQLERQLVRQAADDAARHPQIEQHVEQQTTIAHLQGVATALDNRLTPQAQHLDSLIQRALGGDRTAVDQLDILERISHAHQQATTAPGPLNEVDHTVAIHTAVGQTNTPHSGYADATAAARVHAYHELRDQLGNAAAVPLPPGTGIRARIDTATTTTRTAMDNAGAAARARVIAEARGAVPPPRLAPDTPPEARQAAVALHQRRLQDAQNAVTVPGGRADRAEQQARDTVLRRLAGTFYTDNQADRLTWASLMRNQPHVISQLEHGGTTRARIVQHGIEAPVRGPASTAAEWRIRTDAARQEQLNADPPRQLPSGFGELDAAGNRQYPLGYRGRVMRLGDAWFGDDRAIATLVGNTAAPSVPITVRNAVKTAMTEQLATLGNRAVAQRMLEGGLRFSVTVDGHQHEVTVGLGLGPAEHAHYVPAIDTQRGGQDAPAAQQTPIGQKHHGAVEGDHENIAGTRIGGSSSRAITANVNFTTHFGEVPSKVFSGTAEIALTGDSSKSWAFGNDGVSATKRFLDVGGKESQFDFPGATLTVEVKPAGTAGPGHLNSAPAPVRVGFPQEMTPRQPDGGGPALPHIPRGAGNPVLGVTPAQVDGNQAAKATAGRVHKTLGTVMHIPESISGLGDLRNDLVAHLPSHAVALGSDLHNGIQHWVSETNLLRNYGDMNTVGAMSTGFTTADGKATAHLNVTSQMLSAQRVGEDPVPMKEESQRWVNTNSSSSQGGGIGLTPIKGNFGYTIGDPTAAFGLNHSAGLGFSIGAKLSSTRTTNENTGAGEVRGLVYDAPSRLYRLTTRMTVDVTSDLKGFVNGAGPLATRDVTTFVRVPLHEADRFEALINRETAGPYGSHAWQTANAQVPRDRDPRPSDPVAAQAMNTAEAQVKHPPASLAANQGIGFSAISKLSGSERLIPQIEETLKQVEHSRTWAPEWSPLEKAYLRRQLLTKFSREAMINRGTALFQPGGVKERLYRPVDGGTEVITIQVKAEKTAAPPVSGRVASAKLELMPAGFAGHGGSDSLSATITGALNGGFTGGIGGKTENNLRQFGPSGEISVSSTKSAATGVGSSGFQLKAMLYGGPARTFDYNVEYVVKVGVKHVATVTPGDWPKMAYNKVKSLARPADPNAATIATDHGERSLTYRLSGSPGNEHQVRFVVPEGLARDTPAANPNAGALTRHPYAVPAPRRPARQSPDIHSTVQLPDIPPVLKAAHTPLNGDDLVMEAIGSHHLETEVNNLLTQVGIRPEHAGDISWTATGTEMLTGAQVRGPSPITATMVRQGIIKDKNTVIRIEGFPLNGAPTPHSLRTVKMDVAEGGSNVTGTPGEATTSKWKAGISFGTQAGKSNGDQKAFPGLGRQGDLTFLPNQSTSHTTGLGPVSGRLTQVTENFNEHKADMLYRVTVIRQDKNMFSTSTPKVAAGLVQVTDGLHYLRSGDPHADPHDPTIRAATNPAPQNKPTLIRTAEPVSPSAVNPPTRRPNDKVIPHFPATQHDLNEINAGRPGRQLPTDPLVPHAAASERLLVPPTNTPHAFDVTGDGNPLLSSVQSLLQHHAPEALEEYWQVVGPGGPRERPVPTKLSTLLNVGSSEALLDTMLGPGLILHTTKNGFLGNDRIWMLLRAKRDPENKGYYFLENVQGANTVRYHFRLNQESDSLNKPRGIEWSSSTRIAETPENTGRFDSVSITPAASLSTSSAKGSSVGKVDASRNTLFVGGSADRYAGDLQVDMTIVKTPNPSRFLNTVGLTIPDKISMLLHNKLDMSRADGHAQVTLTERVLIPESLQKPDIEPYTPGPTHVAVSEVAPTTQLNTLTNRPLPITGKQLMDRQVFNLGFDHDKLQVLVDETLKRLAGNIPPMDRSHNFATERMVSHGSRSRDALFSMLSHPMMTNELEFMVDHNGLVSPLLVREGGLFTDTHAKITIKVEPFDPRIGNHFDGGLESNTYHFNETGQNRSAGNAWGLNTSAGFTDKSGSLDPNLPADSHDAQRETGALNLGMNQSNSKSSFVVHKDMPRVTSRNRDVPWLRVKNDALVRITVEARNQRGPIDLPGGTTELAFHVRNGLDLAFSPELALQMLDSHALHEHGTPTPSGVFIPAKGVGHFPDDGARQLQAAFAFPKVDNATVVHVHSDPAAPGNFLVGDRSLTPQQFNDQVLRHQSLPDGQLLVLVGCDLDVPLADGRTPAQIIRAAHPTVHVVSGTGDAHSTPSGSALAGTFQYDANHRAQTGTWQRGDWTLRPAGGGPAVSLGHDLTGALKNGLGAHIPGANFTVTETGKALPPTEAVTWGGGGAAKDFPTLSVKTPASAPASAPAHVPAHATATTIPHITVTDTSLPHHPVTDVFLPEAAPRHPAPGSVAIPGGSWFPRENSTPLQQTAAHSVPGAEGWHLLVGHGEPGKVEINGQLVDHTGVLPHATGTDKQAFITCYAAAPLNGGPSLIHQSHLDTGKPTLGPTHEAIVTTNGDVISGTMGIDTKTGRPVVLPKGTWTLYDNGQPHTLNTPSLKEAWNQLGATPKVHGPAPTEPVPFVHGVSSVQHEGLANHGYVPVEHQGSFFGSLSRTSPDRLTQHFGGTPPTEPMIRQAMHDMLQSELTNPESQYTRYLTAHGNSEQVLSDLHSGENWPPQLAEIAPHLAADTFRLDLGVVGSDGQPLAAGLREDLPRTGHTDGSQFLLTKVDDNRYVPTERLPGAEGPRTPYHDAGHLLDDLKASVHIPDVRELPPPGPLGVDLYGRLRPHDVPEFMRDPNTGQPYDYSRLTPDQSAQFLHQMDMRYDYTPEEMNPATFDVAEGSLSVTHQRTDLKWAPNPDIPPLTSGKVQIPGLVHAIWFGGPLREHGPSAGFWSRYGNAARKFDGQSVFVLWTDVSREHLNAVSGLSEAPSDPHLADVWHMRNWADTNNVRLVNIHEVFNAARPMGLHTEVLTELQKATGPGWAAASDGLRIELETVFGGKYSDGDNTIRSLLGLSEAAKSDAAFAAHADGKIFGNSAFVAPPEHPFFVATQEQYAANYRKTQPELFGPAVLQMHPKFFTTPMGRPRRNSVMLRTGPDAIVPVAAKFGWSPIAKLPRIVDVRMGTDASWLAKDNRPPRVWSKAETLDLTQQVVHTMVRSLYNRGGDLNLLQAADAIARHPQPELVWEGAIKFLASRDDLRSLVRGVTMEEVQPGVQPNRVLDLPPVVNEFLQKLTGERAPIGDGEGWWLGARSVPVHLRGSVGPAVDMSTGVWFPRENPTPLQQTAAHAVPGAEGWHLIVGHGEPGKVEINGQLVDHTGVLPHTTGADKQAFITCYADAPVDGGLSLIHQSHLDTGKPTLGPTHEAIVTTDGDVISGTMGIDTKTGRPVVVPQGTWTLYENGRPRTLNTPSLKEAWNQLGATPKVHGPAPTEPVGFVYGVSGAQHSGLAKFGYAPIHAQIPNANRPDSFFTALTTMATPHLSTHFGGTPPTEPMIRQALHDALRADLTNPGSRYERFLAPNETPAQLLNDLLTPGRWSPQLGELAPHLAADVFHLDLGVVGASGVPEGAGQILGPHRTGHADGNPLLLVRVGDNHYVPTTRIPGGPARNVPRADQTHGTVHNAGPGPSPWSRPLTRLERNLVQQAGNDAVRHPQIEQQVEARTTVAHVQGVTNSLGGDLNGQGAQVRDLMRRALTGDRTAVDQLDTLERISGAHQQATTAPGPLNETAHTTAVQHAVTWTHTLHTTPADATVAARVHAYHELREQLDTASATPPPPGTGIRGRIDTLGAAAGGAMDRAGRAARQEVIGQARATVRRYELGPGATPEAHAQLEARYQRDLRAAEDAATTPGGPADRAEQQARDAVLKQHTNALYTGDQFDRLRWAMLHRSQPHRIADAEYHGAAAARQVQHQAEAPVRGPATTAAEWRIRTDAARHLQLRADPPRQLPAGFGELDAAGNRQYPLGYRGRVMRLGDVWFGDDAAVAALVSRSLPPGTHADIQTAVNAAMHRKLTELGNRAVAQRMLEDGLKLRVTVGGRRHDVTVGLDLGNADRAHYLPPVESQRGEQNAPAAQRTPFGQKHHGAVESDHENIAGTRLGGSNSRSISASADVADALGVGIGFTAGVTISGDSSKSWSYGNDGVSATKRFLDMSGKESQFDFADARLTVQIRSHGAAGPAPSHTVPLSARLGFPKELTPHQPDGGGPVLPTVRRGAGNPVLGLTPTALDGGGAQARDTARRVHATLGTVMHIPESIAGLNDLRDAVKAALPNHAVDLGSGLHDGIDHWISEPNLLRNYGDLNAVGTLSPAYDTANGRVALLNVKSTMLNAQRVGEDPVPLKEESQRFVNTNSSTSEGGGIGLTPVKLNAGFTVGDPQAPAGYNHSFGLSFSVGARLGSTRTTNENTGAGDIRGLVYDGPSRLYRLTTRMTVDVTSDLKGFVNDAGPLATRDVTTFVRVPLHEADRFEAQINRELAGPPTSHAWQTAHAQVPRDRDPRPSDPAAAQAMNTAEAQVKHPPAALATNQGIGFSAISKLAGAEKVIPRIEQTLQQLEYSRTWAPEWAPLEKAYLRKQLLAKFSREALINRGGALFRPGGVKERLYRPVDGGTEVITVTVTAHKLPVAPVSGRVASTKLELMPAAFAGHGGSDSLSSSLSAALSGSFTGGTKAGQPFTKTDSALQLGPAGELSGTLGKSASTSVGASGFQLQAMLYSGPARTFDYQVDYRVRVGIKHVPTPTTVSDLPKLAVNRLISLAGRPDPLRNGQTRNSVLSEREYSLTANLVHSPGNDQTVRFVVPEGLALDTPHADPNTGALTRHPYAVPAPQRPTRQSPDLRATVQLPDIPAALKAAHTPLNGDDLVMETFGSHHLESEVRDLLTRVGVKQDTAGDISWTSTGTEMLSGAHVRGPSPITATFVQQGVLKDKNTVIRIEGFPLNGAPTPQGLRTMKMDVAEGGSNVSGRKGSSRDTAWKVGIAFGDEASRHNGSQSVFPGLSRKGDIGFLPNRNSSNTTGLGPVSGRLTQVTENHRQHSADMLYRVTVIRQDKNMFGVSTPKVAASLLEVNGGVHYLRSSDPHADPHDPSIRTATVAAPQNRPTLIRTDQNATAGAAGVPTRRTTDKVIPTIPATVHDLNEINAGRPGKRLPADPLIPHAAASERLLVPPTNTPHAFDVTGDGNPLLSSVRQLLQTHAPGALEDYWQVVGHGGKEQPLPTNLSTLLNVGSAEALLDTMLGPGLILHTTKSGILGNDRIWMLLRAERDPQNKGYYYLENVQGANTVRYHFRLNQSATGKGTGKAFEWGLSGKFADGPDNTGTFTSGSGSVSGTVSHSTGKGTSQAHVDASRNTLFVSGEANRYAGELKVETTIVKTPNPSRFLNTVGLTIPDKISMLLHNKLDAGKADGRASVTLTERALIPEALHKPDLEPYVPPPGAVAVREIAPTTNVNTLGAPLRITKQDLLDRQVTNLGFDHDKLRVLIDESLKRLTGNVTPANRSQNFATERMFSHGSRSRDALFAMLSHPMMTNELEFLVDHNGLVSPLLAREGGLFTDTHAKITIKVEPFDPRVQNHFDGWLESNSYRFTESGQNRSESDGGGLGIGFGLSGISMDPGPHDSPQKTTGSMNVGTSQSRSKSSFVVHKDMPRVTSRNREIPWLRAKTDAVVRIKVEARNQRGPLDFPGGTTEMAFHVHNGLELTFTPERALELLNSHALHENGTPTPSGAFIPAKGRPGFPDDGMAQLQAAFGFPKVDNATVLHVHGDPATPGNFVVGNRSLTPQQFNDQVLRHQDLAPGRLLVLVGCDVNTPIAGGPSPAQTIRAANPGVHIISADSDVHSTPGGAALAGTFGYDANHRPRAGTWQPGNWILTPAGGGAPIALGPDLIGSLKDGLGAHLPGTSFTVTETGKSLPPITTVRWGGSSAGAAFPTLKVSPPKGLPTISELPELPELPVLPEPVAASSSVTLPPPRSGPTAVPTPWPETLPKTGPTPDPATEPDPEPKTTAPGSIAAILAGRK